MKAEIIIEVKDDNQYILQDRIEKYEKIFRLLIEKGALDGVRGGSTNIHFDDKGNFKGIEFKYFTWRERS